MTKLSDTMTRVLAQAPPEWAAIPTILDDTHGTLRVSFSTLWALRQRGAIGLRLHGRPRAAWQWCRATSTQA